MNKIIVLIMFFVITGCGGCFQTRPVIQKSSHGNLEINILNDDINSQEVELYLDGIPIGNLSNNKPVLHLREGLHTIRAKYRGYKDIERKIHIFTKPNHQVLNLRFEK